MSTKSALFSERKTVSECLWEATKKCTFDSVCGVPYTALPIATCMSVDHNIPMLIRRKEAKDYGTKKIIEGCYREGETCLVVEDVVTSGSSVAETAELLVKAGLRVTDAVVLLNREQGGEHKLAAQGIHLHSLCPLSKVLEVLEKAGKLSSVVVDSVREFVRTNQFSVSVNPQSLQQHKVFSYKERLSLCTNSLTKKLLTIMEVKHSNLCVAADYPNVGLNLLIEFAEEVGPHICMLKLHTDFIPAREIGHQQYQAQLNQLKQIAIKHNFLIFDDRKFADIGNTVSVQYSSGTFSHVQYSDIVTVHPLPGPGIIHGLKKEALSCVEARGCLLIGQMSSKGCLIDEKYTKSAVAMAEDNRDFVIGFICRERLSNDASLIHCVPGVKLHPGGDSLGQQYLTPDVVIAQKGCDVIIVGRGITQAENPGQAAERYKRAGYQAYLKSIMLTD